MDNARRTAVLALARQEESGYSNIILSHVLERFSGKPRDKAFISTIYYGTIERRLTLDYILNMFLKRSIDKIDSTVRNILRSGLYQAKYMDSVPVSAAVCESVALVKALGKTSASGLVNAVLRKAAAVDINSLSFKNDIERISVLCSVNKDIVRIFIAEYGDMAESQLNATFEKRPICLRVNTLKTNIEELETLYLKQDILTKRGILPNCLYVEYKGDITNTKAFRNGLFYVQSEASQAACAALSPKRGCKVLDLCSAPGGKSATLAQYMENEGQLLSCDSSGNRLGLVEELLSRIGVKCAKTQVNDAQVYNAEFENSDYVLCDVPCSGIGTLGKKPDIRYKSMESLSELIRLQKNILFTASRYVKQGGKLVYSTCTINSDENEKQVKEFVEQNKEFVIRKINNVAPNAQNHEEMLKFSPLFSFSEGFFVAYLERMC